MKPTFLRRVEDPLIKKKRYPNQLNKVSMPNYKVLEELLFRSYVSYCQIYPDRLYPIFFIFLNFVMPSTSIIKSLLNQPLIFDAQIQIHKHYISILTLKFKTQGASGICK